MTPSPGNKDEQAQFRHALQEHEAFKRQCVQFRARVTQLRRSIDTYQEQLAALHREYATRPAFTYAELRKRVAEIQQQMGDAESDLHELRFEFHDLAARYKELRKTGFPRPDSRF